MRRNNVACAPTGTAYNTKRPALSVRVANDSSTSVTSTSLSGIPARSRTTPESDAPGVAGICACAPRDTSNAISATRAPCTRSAENDGTPIACRGRPQELEHTLIEVVRDLLRETAALRRRQDRFRLGDEREQEIDGSRASGDVPLVRLAGVVAIGQRGEVRAHGRPDGGCEAREGATQRR